MPVSLYLNMNIRTCIYASQYLLSAFCIYICYCISIFALPSTSQYLYEYLFWSLYINMSISLTVLVSLPVSQFLSAAAIVNYFLMTSHTQHDKKGRRAV